MHPRFDLAPHSPVAYLRRMRDILSTPDTWTKREMARNEFGQSCYTDQEMAVCFCLAGARRAAGEDGSDVARRAWWAVKSQSRKRGFGNAVEFNDSSATTHADVIQLLDEAIVDELRAVAS